MRECRISCSNCNGTNCQNSDDCKTRTRTRPNQSRKCFYILLVLGLILIFVGALLFLKVIKSAIIDNPFVDEGIDYIDNNDTLSDPLDYDYKSIDDSIKITDILLGVIALIILCAGVIFIVGGVRLKRRSTENIQSTKDDSTEFVHSEGAQIELTSFVEGPLNPESSKECKRPRYSQDCDAEVEEFIPKTHCHNETEKVSIPKNPSEIFHYIPPNDEDSLILFRDGYPYAVCDQKILEVVHRMIEESRLNIKTKYVKLEDEDGYIKIAHLKNTTREWFQRTDPNSFLIKLQSEIQFDMKIKPFQYIAKFISLSCVLMEPIEDAEFLSTIRTENGIDTSRCIIEKCEPVPDGFKIFFWVKPMCFKLIKEKNNLLKINQRIIEVILVNNPFPELFNDQ